MATGNKLSFKYLSTGTLTAEQLTQYADAIVFVASENAIYTHGTKFGLTADEAQKVTDLQSAVLALQKFDADLKYFSNITDGTGTKAGAASPGATLKFTGANDISVTVGADGVKIDGNTIKTAAANAKSAADSALTTADQAVADAAGALAEALKKVSSVTGSNAIAVTTGTTPQVSLKLNTTAPGNVTLSQDTDGLKASVTLPAVPIKSIKADDPLIKLTGTELSSSISFGLTGNKIQLKGQDDTVIGEVDTTDFVKDGLLDSASFDTSTKILTLTFNTDSGKEPVDVDLSSLVDTYTGKNLKLSSDYGTATATAPAAGVSIDSAIKKLATDVTAAASAGVTSFEGKTGAITVDTTASADKSVKFTMKDNKLTAVVNGVATDEQGAKADTAIQNITKGTDGSYVTTTVGGTGTDKTVGVALTMGTMATATTKGVAEVSDVKNYVDTQLTWEEL